MLTTATDNVVFGIDNNSKSHGVHGLLLSEPSHEKTCFLHVQKQRRRSAV